MKQNRFAKHGFGRVLQKIAVILLLCVPNSIAKAQTTTALSGSVVDVQGNPIPGITIGIQPVVIKNNIAVPMSAGAAEHPQSRTDSQGRFNLTNIRPGPLQFRVMPVEPITEEQRAGSMIPTPNFEPPLEILSVKIGGIIFHHRHTFTGSGGTTFSIKPGEHVKNIKVKARYRVRLHGRIVFADETPLANKQVQVKVARKPLKGANLFSPTQWELQTDAEGYFVKYSDGVGVYTVSIHYEEKRVLPTTFRITAGQRHYEVPILRFSSKSFPLPEPPPDIEPPLDATTVWVVNPENGHAYKRIGCKNVEDARNQADAENAYLVAINDEAEQEWLAEIFGNHLCWVGLKRNRTGREWLWDTGEPLTFTNWTPYGGFQHQRPLRKNIHVVVNFSDGTWHAIRESHSLWRKVHMAILEKNAP